MMSGSHRPLSHWVYFAKAFPSIHQVLPQIPARSQQFHLGLILLRLKADDFDGELLRKLPSMSGTKLLGLIRLQDLLSYLEIRPSCGSYSLSKIITTRRVVPMPDVVKIKFYLQITNHHDEIETTMIGTITSAKGEFQPMNSPRKTPDRHIIGMSGAERFVCALFWGRQLLDYRSLRQLTC
jgi:hypothetical protein